MALGFKVQSGDSDSSCGLRPEPGVLCATKYRVIENNRGNFGELQTIIEYPQSEAVPQKKCSRSDP